MSGLIKQVQNWFAAGLRRAELDRIDRSELGRIANDAGVSPGELGELVAEGTDAAWLLPRRLHVQNLDIDAIVRDAPATLRDMQRVCSHCGYHERCEYDLVRNAQDPRWETYCPNAQTMRALKADAGQA